MGLIGSLQKDATAVKIFEEENRLYKLTGCMDNGFQSLALDISITSKSGEYINVGGQDKSTVETLRLEHPKAKSLKPGKWVLVADSEISGIINSNSLLAGAPMKVYKQDSNPIVLQGAHTKMARSKACAARYIIQEKKFIFTPDNVKAFWDAVNKLAASFSEPGDMLSFSKIRDSELSSLAEF